MRQAEAVVTPVQKNRARRMGEDVPSLLERIGIFFIAAVSVATRISQPFKNLQTCPQLVHFISAKHAVFVMCPSRDRVRHTIIHYNSSALS